MEDRASSENTSNFSTVVSLLRQAESLLSSQAMSPGNQVQSTEATSQSTLISGAGQSQTVRTERSLANFPADLIFEVQLSEFWQSVFFPCPFAGTGKVVIRSPKQA